MDRRRFLKMVGVASLSALVPITVHATSPSKVVATSLRGRVYRGDRHGRIFYSSDNGSNWHLHTNLGPANSVRRMGRDHAGRVTATVGHAGREYRLELSRDERFWRTA